VLAVLVVLICPSDQSVSGAIHNRFGATGSPVSAAAVVDEVELAEPDLAVTFLVRGHFAGGLTPLSGLVAVGNCNDVDVY